MCIDISVSDELMTKAIVTTEPADNTLFLKDVNELPKTGNVFG